MTDDLVTWLRAQLDDDERAARAVADRSWGYQLLDDPTGPVPLLHLGDRTTIIAAGFDDDPLTGAEAEHIARWDPARALAEVDAKRRILDFLDPTDAPDGEGKYVAERVLLLMALPHANRPGSRDEWTADDRVDRPGKHVANCRCLVSDGAVLNVDLRCSTP